MIGEKILCGLDVGSYQLKVGVIKTKKGERTVLLATSERPTRGFKENAVTDLGEFSECIHDILKDTAKKSGIKIKDIQLGLGGHLIEPRYSKAIVPLVERSSKVITQGDVKRVTKQARLLGIKMEEEILHDFPQYFTIDDTGKILNPAGLYGRKLGVLSLLIASPANLVGNMTRAVNQVGYEVANVFFTSFAAAQVTLTGAMAENGSLLIDIGARTTSILFFKDGLLKHLDIIPVGGENFTGRITQALQLPFGLAEGIKKSHATVLGDDNLNNGDILVKKEDSYLTVKQKVICESIEPEVEKLIGSIQNILQFSHVQEKLKSGIVMIGGGSLLAGLIERIEKVTKIPVKMGQVEMGPTALPQAAMFTGAVGLAKAAVTVPNRFPSAAKTSKDWVSSIPSRMRELYEEYF